MIHPVIRRLEDVLAHHERLVTDARVDAAAFGLAPEGHLEGLRPHRQDHGRAGVCEAEALPVARRQGAEATPRHRPLEGAEQ